MKPQLHMQKKKKKPHQEGEKQQQNMPTFSSKQYRKITEVSSIKMDSNSTGRIQVLFRIGHHSRWTHLKRKKQA